MFFSGNSLQRQAFAGRPGARIAFPFLFVLLMILTLGASGAFAQTVSHVTNPFAGATFYVNPDWTNEVGTAAAGQPTTLANQMAVVGTYPTAVWLDHIAAISGGNGRLSLQQHINAALAQQAKSGTNQPIVVELVIYDLPDRDCAALASNGELSIAGGDTIVGPNGTPITLTGTGLQEYENDYITPIANTLQTVATNPNIRFVLVVEDDSLPNMITNVGQAPNPAIQACVNANAGVSGQPSLNGVYVQGIQFALSTFHKLPNVYNYLDVGHHGWLGWPNNFQPGVDFLTAVAKGTTAGIPSVDGFITNTANYGPTTEPFMTSDESIGGQPVHSATFYHFNPFIDEESYAAALDAAFVQAGFPSTVGFLIDTSRNGWGSTLRPKGPSTSTVVDTFVNATKIDGRNDMGQWCNQPNAGLGVPPTVTPGGFANLQAYVWIKPPGESDGNYPGSVFNGVTSTVGDPNCNPTHSNSLANNTVSGAVANSPKAGTFWASYFTMLVQNAFPAVSASTAPSFSVASTGVSVLQGQSTTTSVTISAVNGFSGAVTLSASGLPTGVTASFSPSMVTGSAGSTLTLTAAGNAAVGPATVTITGTSTGTGTTSASTASANITVTVVAKPDFTITAPTSVNVTAGSTATASLAVGFVGGLTGSVAVQASGLPAGVSANFAPNSVNANGTITASFFAQPGTPNESANVTITATNGQGTTAITHTVTIAVSVGGVVNQNPSFTLAPSAATLSVAANGSATDTITVTDGGGFSGPVTLKAAGAPTGVTVAFGTNPATSSSVVTVTAGSTAVAGSFTLTISGSGTSAAGTALTASTTVAVSIGGTVVTPPPGACHIGYTITNQWTPGFQVSLSIDNTSTTAINGWTLGWTFPNGQTVTQLWNGAETQSGAAVTVKSLNYNASIAAGGSYKDAGFTGTWSGTNGIPSAFTLNGAACTVN
jgi:cellulose 1,4-beta-cellobiosidase